MTKFCEYVGAILKCRDLWASTNNGNNEEDPRAGQYVDFVEWIISCVISYETEGTPLELSVEKCFDEMKRLADESETEMEVLKGAMMINGPFKQYYRIAKAIDFRSDEPDRRVRQYVDEICFNGKKSTAMRRGGLPLTSLISSFFTFRESEAIFKRSSGKFSGHMSTNFQRLVFVTAVYSVSTLERERRMGRDRPRKYFKISTYDKKARVYKSIVGLSSAERQRLSCCLQQVVLSWDLFAFFLGFEDVEDLILPYARITSDTMLFVVAMDRKEGYVRSCEASCLGFDNSLTMEAAETYRGVTERSSYLDLCLRALARSFFADVYNEIEELCSYKEDMGAWVAFLERWRKKEIFIYPGIYGAIPARFSSIPGSMMKFIRREVVARRNPIRNTIHNMCSRVVEDSG